MKLGGSHANGPHLKDWLAAIAAEAGSIAIVPGGGPFADAVRAAQASMGYDDRAAHAMALMAMAQFGRALQSLNPALTLAASRSAILRALKERQGSGLVAGAEMVRAAPMQEAWELDSDGLAASLTDALGAGGLLFISIAISKRRRSTSTMSSHVASLIRSSTLCRGEPRSGLARPSHPTAQNSPMGCGKQYFLK